MGSVNAGNQGDESMNALYFKAVKGVVRNRLKVPKLVNQGESIGSPINIDPGRQRR